MQLHPVVYTNSLYQDPASVQPPHGLHQLEEETVSDQWAGVAMATSHR